MSCPKGQIMRTSFTRKDGTVVSEGCVKDRGRSGKGAKILPVPKKSGFLHKYGYALDKTPTQRHKALKKALAKENDLEVMRHLNLIRNITATGTPNKEKLSQDVKFLSKTYKKSKSRSRKVSRTGGKRRTTQTSRSRSKK